MIAIVLAVGLPDEDDILAMKRDEFYRVIYGFPWVFQALTLVLCLTCYREDSIVFLIQQGKDDEAIKTIEKVYSKEEDSGKILSGLKRSSTMSKKSSTSKDAKEEDETRITIT